MDIEVEIRAKIKDRENFKKRIESLGAEFFKQHIFFNTYHGLSLFRDKDIQIRVSDSYCINLKQWECYIGYKGPEKGKGVNVREEIDEKFGRDKGPSKTLEKLGIKGVPLISTSQIRDVLEKNGFNFFMTMIGDNDERFIFGDLRIKFMNLPQIGVELMEVEKVVSEEEIDKAAEEVRQFMRNLGLSKEDEIKQEPVQLTYQHYFRKN